MMKIGIIGTGYVGLIQAIGLAKLGFKIISADIDKEKISKLKSGEIPFFEKGLEDLFEETKRDIKYTSNYKDLNQCDIIFVTVGTPQDRRGRTNKEFIYKTVSTIKEQLDGKKIIVIKSTVPAGTNREISNILGPKFEVVSNPEFLREGNAVNDFFNPNRIIVGFSDNVSIEAKNKLKELYAYFIHKNVPYIETNRETAELTKYASNSFLAMKISFINELAQLSDKIGANIKIISEGMGLDKRIGKDFLHAGIGYGGSCFPKDVRSLIHQFKENKLEGALVKATDEVNERQLLYFINKISHFYDNLNGKNFLLLGLAFKPYTDDLRESRAIELAKKLYEKGANIYGYDIVEKARENAKKRFNNILKVVDDISKFNFNKINGIIIATEYREFNELDRDNIKQEIYMPIIFDGRNILDKEKIQKKGFIYKGIGL